MEEVFEAIKDDFKKWAMDICKIVLSDWSNLRNISQKIKNVNHVTKVYIEKIPTENDIISGLKNDIQKIIKNKKINTNVGFFFNSYGVDFDRIVSTKMYEDDNQETFDEITLILEKAKLKQHFNLHIIDTWESGFWEYGRFFDLFPILKNKISQIIGKSTESFKLEKNN